MKPDKTKCLVASDQGEQGVNVNQFWVDMISAFRRGIFGETKQEQQRFVKVMAEERENPPGSSKQGRWKSYTLFIEPNGGHLQHHRSRVPSPPHY
ncbi:MAG: hypothetical protein ABSG78_18760 [Verrucomicrobiota bacterium]|jgi:hypothetical protein